MDSLLAISAAIFLAAVGVGLWSQYCLPRLSDNRNILFIICFFSVSDPPLHVCFICSIYCWSARAHRAMLPRSVRLLR